MALKSDCDIITFCYLCTTNTKSGTAMNNDTSIAARMGSDSRKGPEVHCSAPGSPAPAAFSISTMSSTKKAQYFPHDQDAGDDPKLAALEADMRGLGTGIYWRAVENLHKQGGYLPTDYKLLAYIFRNCTPEELRHVVEDFDLFHYTDDGGKFYSDRVLANLGKRDSISTARRNARNGVGAGTPGNGSEKAAGEQKNSEANKYTLLLLNTASRAFTQEEHQTFLKYNGPADDIVTFLETMFFTKCCTNAAAEVARFIQYYQPTGWKRKGEVVTDRVSLLSGWKPDEGSGKISNKTGVTLLRNAYLGAKKDGDPQALYIILQTKGISFSNDNKVNILTGKEASQVITKHATINEGWNLDFRIK